MGFKYVFMYECWSLRMTNREIEIEYIPFKLVGEKLGRKCFQSNRIKKEKKYN